MLLFTLGLFAAEQRTYDGSFAFEVEADNTDRGTYSIKGSLQRNKVALKVHKIDMTIEAENGVSCKVDHFLYDGSRDDNIKRCYMFDVVEDDRLYGYQKFTVAYKPFNCLLGWCDYATVLTIDFSLNDLKQRNGEQTFEREIIFYPDTETHIIIKED